MPLKPLRSTSLPPTSKPRRALPSDKRGRGKRNRTAFKLARAQHHKQVASCHKCHGWFPSVQARKVHKCPGKVGAR